MNVFEEIRNQYETRGLDRKDLAADPMDQFDQWFDEANDKCPGKWVEPNAMTLSTCVGNIVTSRTVLLKEHKDHRFVFFTNYDSEKGHQLQKNPFASLLFYWPYLNRQIRINGHVAKTTRAKSESYFHSRSRGSQLGAYVSSQTRELGSREILEEMSRELQKRLDGKPVPLPETWGGFALRPDRYEFWQGRTDRLHDRFQYTCNVDDGIQQQTNHEWQISRLFP